MTENDVNIAGKYTAYLSMTEMGLGSVLHAWHIPLSGHFLSLNQGFLLCRATQESSHKSPSLSFRISVTTAILKSLSPMGKRLTPMLAISAQGFLYSFGQYFFGTSFFGSTISVMLLSLWAFVQPALIYWLIFGSDILKVGDYYFQWIQKEIPISYSNLIFAAVAFVILKLILGILTVVAAFKISDRQYENYIKNLIEKFPRPMKPVPTRFSEKLKLVFRDLLQPWFLFSLALMVIFSYVNPENSNQVKNVWFLLRPIAVGFIVFYAIRLLPLDQWLLRIFNQNSKTFVILSQALCYIKSNGKDSVK